MTAPGYRAYVSYSHKDEAWAKWLHHALESYRVPRKLVGSQTAVGEVPARIRPVFRDRDDLSSSADLAESIKQVLADSENLIVICSPEAAASHWVGEEIRQFARLGGTDRIFCMVVDGDPVSSDSKRTCFPAALAEIGIHEPLAADVRKWADGKRNAKLKLVAGLLGLRLDDFLQRNLQRRRKRQVLTGFGLAAILALGIITVAAQISERHEREKAEQLATFVVDLGERLRSDVDLETLGLISDEAARHLQNLDQDRLSPGTGIRVALAIRQMGRVSQFQGRSDEALEAYKRSRDLFARLNDKYPTNPDIMFELGNAEYYIGDLHFSQHRYNNALDSMQAYHRMTQALLDQDPGNPDWIMELSYSHNNLAAVHLSSGKGVDETILAHVNEAIRLMETVVSLRPDDQDVAGDFSTLLAWAADAQLGACNLEEAASLRHGVIQLAEFSTQKDPGDNELRKQHAYALTGLARVQAFTGEWDVAAENLGLAVSILQSLLAADPSNLHYREETLFRQVMLARLLGEIGQLDEAVKLMAELEIEFGKLDQIPERDNMNVDEYIEFFLSYADAQLRQGNRDSAKAHLETAIELLIKVQNGEQPGSSSRHQAILSHYLWWQLEGDINLVTLPAVLPAGQSGSTGYKSCVAADYAARAYIIKGQRENAMKEVEYLKDKGYREPSFVRFCSQHGLCSQ